MSRNLLSAAIPIVALSVLSLATSDARAGNPNFRKVQNFQARPVNGNFAFTGKKSFPVRTNNTFVANKAFINQSAFVTNKAFINKNAFVANKPFVNGKPFVKHGQFVNKNVFIPYKSSFVHQTKFVGPYNPWWNKFNASCYPYCNVSYPYFGCYPQYSCYPWYGWCGTGNWCW